MTISHAERFGTMGREREDRLEILKLKGFSSAMGSATQRACRFCRKPPCHEFGSWRAEGENGTKTLFRLSPSDFRILCWHNPDNP